MEQFNLNKAKQGYLVQTADGRDVRILAFDMKGKYSIVGLMKDNVTNTEDVQIWDSKGNCPSYFNVDSPLKLYMKSQKKDRQEGAAEKKNRKFTLDTWIIENNVLVHDRENSVQKVRIKYEM